MSENFVGFCSFERREQEESFANIARVSSKIESIRNMIDKKDHENSENSNHPDQEQTPDLDTDLGKGIWDFYDNLKSLYELASVSDVIPMTFVSSFFRDMLLKHAEAKLPIVETYNEVPIFGLDSHASEYINKSIKKWNDIEAGFSKLPQAVLLSVVAAFDTAFSEFCKMLLKSRPERLSSGDKRYSLSEILKYGSFDKVVDLIVDEEIDQLMRKSHSDQIEFFEKMFNISIKAHYKRWGEFVEIFERRNLCAHGNLLVNETYIENCRKNQYKISCKTGEFLTVDSKYLEHSIDILIEFGILLAFASWQKQVPASIAESFEAMVEVSFNLLSDDHPNVAANILEYAMSVKSKGADEKATKMMIVNLAIAYKDSSRTEECESIIDGTDWSASSPIFKVCANSVIENTDEVIKYLESAKLSDGLSIEAIRTWPSFKWMIQNEDFKDACETVFGEPIFHVKQIATSGKVIEMAAE